MPVFTLGHQIAKSVTDWPNRHPSECNHESLFLQGVLFMQPLTYNMTLVEYASRHKSLMNQQYSDLLVQLYN